VFVEHFIALEDMRLPEGLLDYWESIENLEDETFFDLNHLSHSFGCHFRVIYIGDKTLKTKNLTSQHRLFIDKPLTSKLSLATSFLDKVKIFSDLAIIDDLLSTIKGILFV